MNSPEDNNPPTAAKQYFCDECKEELEYITTYKQWYCYNCQKYVTISEQAAAPKPESEAPVQLSDEVAESESDSTVSWDSGDQPGSKEDEEELEGPETTEVFDDDGELDHLDERDESEESEGSEEPDDSGEVTDDNPEGSELTWDETVEFDVTEDVDDEEFEEEPQVIPLESTSIEDAEVKYEKINNSSIPNGTQFVATELAAAQETQKSPVLQQKIEDIQPSNLAQEPEEDLEFEIDQDSIELEDAEQAPKSGITKGESKPKSSKETLNKLHQAWIRVNNLQGLIPNNERINTMASELKNALKGSIEPQDAAALAEKRLSEITVLEKEFKEIIHHNVSELFHFVNSKLNLAKKIGFTVDTLEEELDSISSLIARSEYHLAGKNLEELLQKIQTLPKTQDEIMIGLEEKSAIIQELLEPRLQSSS
jgi:hypothetical protein